MKTHNEDEEIYNGKFFFYMSIASAFFWIILSQWIEAIISGEIRPFSEIYFNINNYRNTNIADIGWIYSNILQDFSVAYIFFAFLYLIAELILRVIFQNRQK
jgi:hypothetical protein